MNRKPTSSSLPTVEQLEAELKRETSRKRHKQSWHMLRSTVSILIVVAAIVVLISNLFLPVLRIYGSSMTPTLVNGNIVAAMRYGNYDRGDVIAFYYNNKILVKRVIGLPGELVDIDENGNVYFVMGDHRSVSSDSRSSQVGCISEEQIIGKLFFRIWPLNEIGTFE